jgi:hypothetical protein
MEIVALWQMQPVFADRFQVWEAKNARPGQDPYVESEP